MSKFISGLFPDRVEAERAVDALEDLGYAQNDISVIMNENTRERDFRSGALAAEAHDTHVAANVGIGASFGGTLGAIIAGVTATGAIVATGGLAVPFIAGPIAAMLAGAGAGGLAGGLVGMLTAIGVPENHVTEYESELNRGGIVVGVNARPGDEATVSRILIHHEYPALDSAQRDLTRSDYATRGGSRTDYATGSLGDGYRPDETPIAYPSAGRDDLPRGGDVPTRRV
jgi:hypothetical protein